MSAVEEEEEEEEGWTASSLGRRWVVLVHIDALAFPPCESEVVSAVAAQASYGCGRA